MSKEKNNNEISGERAYTKIEIEGIRSSGRSESREGANFINGIRMEEDMCRFKINLRK